MTDLDPEELLVLLETHRRTLVETKSRMEELVREGRRLGLSYPRLEAASGYSRPWLDEIVHERRKRRSAG